LPHALGVRLHYALAESTGRDPPDCRRQKEMEKLMPIVEELYREGGLEPLEELDDDSLVEDPDEEDA
jgi:hypothetical protein